MSSCSCCYVAVMSGCSHCKITILCDSQVVTFMLLYCLSELGLHVTVNVQYAHVDILLYNRDCDI